MTSRAELDALLLQLELDMPFMKADMDSFYSAFEQRAELILRVAEGDEADYVLDCLMTLLRRAGISQRGDLQRPTLH